MTERWARYDTESNALDNLEKIAHFLNQAKCHPEEWKWVVISTFATMYAYAIQVAKGTDDLSVVKETKGGKSRLITFGEAIDICKSPFGSRKALELSESETISINVVQNEFRNKFEHFNPSSWAIEISGFPDHILNCLSVIQRLAVELNFYSHLTEKQREKQELLLKQCHLTASELRDEYT